MAAAALQLGGDLVWWAESMSEVAVFTLQAGVSTMPGDVCP
jgi:hypothetical protein